MSDEVYYKIYYLDREDHVTVVFKDENGKILKFYDEQEAIQWLIDNVKDDKIDPEYKQYGFNQKKFMK